MKARSMLLGAVATAVVASSTAFTTAQAEDMLYVPSLSYRTGAFAGGGIPFANGFADYFNMLNARDGYRNVDTNGPEKRSQGNRQQPDERGTHE